MKDRCGSCKHRSGGCTFSPNPERPIMPNMDEICCWIKMEGRSRWERKSNPHGKIISPMMEAEPYPPNAGPIFCPTPTNEDAMSYVVRGNHQRFWLDKDGNCWADGEKKTFIGHKSDFEEKVPTEEEIQAGIDEVRERFNIERRKDVRRTISKSEGEV